MPEHQSPFIPGTSTQWAWDSTSLGWFKLCPRLYQYSMIEGWRAKEHSPNLDFGLWYHSALETYDKSRADGYDHEDSTRITVGRALTDSWSYDLNQDGKIIPGTGKPWETDDSYKNRETLIRSIIWYLEEFKDHGTETFILANGRAAVELSFKMELDYGPMAHLPYIQELGPAAEYVARMAEPTRYVLSGHLDRIIRFGEDIFVSDRKTTKMALSPRYFDQYSPDNQMSLYTVAAKVVFGSPVKGVMIDAAQIAVGFTRFSRGVVYRTPDQTEEWFTDLKLTLRSAEQMAREGYWPQNDKACGLYGGCAFRKICSKDPSVRGQFLSSWYEKREWNPLIPR